MSKTEFVNKLKYTETERYLVDWWNNERDPNKPCSFDTIEEALEALPNHATIEHLKESL